LIPKILFTALIIFAALLYVRHKNSRGLASASAPEQQAQETESSKTAMFVAIGFVSLTMLVSAVLYYSAWKEKHQVFTVQVINSQTGVEQRYSVYEEDIDDRRFRTIDGRLISLSNIERMEVQAGRIEHK